MMLNMTDTKLESVSPVTLSSDWSRLARLIFLASIASVGSVGNVFMISAVMIEDYLRKRGNTFVVSVALADLLVTGVVIPASAVVILAGLHDNLPVCRFQWFLAALCFLVSVLSLCAVAIETYIRLCCATSTSAAITRRKITIILIIIWLLATAISGAQFAPDLSFDYCTRRNHGLLAFQAPICALFVFLPLALALTTYVCTGWHLHRAKKRPNFKPPPTFNWDVALLYTNVYSCVLFVLFWLPFGVVLAIASSTKPVPDALFYKLAWLAITKSCLNSILYGVCNRHFRAAYVNLFHYCCCKTTVSFSRRTRQEGLRPSGDVRVHIIPGYNMYCSPQRGREGVGKRGVGGRSNGRDVYEL